jgi:hypothetical protein
MLSRERPQRSATDWIGLKSHCHLGLIFSAKAGNGGHEFP